jgi:hypothetical protein
MDQEIVGNAKSLPGLLTVLVLGPTSKNVETSGAVEIRTQKSAPRYPDVVPRQTIIRREVRSVSNRDAEMLVKAYLPGIVMVEASAEIEDILAEGVLEFKRELIEECRRVLRDFPGNREFDEEYSVYCVSGYRGDPEVYLSLHGERIAALLKNEQGPLDEAEVQTTLGASLKYGKDDITLVDWDGAFVFEAEGDFRGDIELFAIANLQLLKARVLNNELDKRLEKTLRLLRTPRGLPVIRSREVRHVLKEIIETRTQSILESETVEHDIKLIGDWYSARLYSLIAKKFHLESWTADIKEKLQTLEDVYTMAADNFSISYRATLEFVILAGWFVLLLLYVGEYLFTGK